MNGLGIDDKTVSATKLRRIKNMIAGAITNPYNVMVTFSLILLAYLIAAPLFEMLGSTFRVVESEVRRIPGSQAEDFTLFYWARLFFSELSRALLYRPLMNSLIIGLCVSLTGIIFGSLLAWLMVRSDLPGKKIFAFAIIIPYMLPSWCKSMAWISVFKNERIGGSPGFLSALGVSTPDWLAYGPIPIILVLSLHYYAFAYLLVSGALRSLNGELEEMGEISGAGRVRILGKITFPLVLPAVLSAFILTFSKAIGTFGVPAFLGMKVNYHTVSTMLYSAVRQRDSNTGYAISLVLIAMAAISIYMNQKAIGIRKGFTTIGGMGGRSNLVALGKWKYPIVGFLLLFIVFGVIMPFAVLLLDTVMLVPGRYSLSNFTLHYWFGTTVSGMWENEPGVLRNPWFWRSIRNSLLIVFSAAAFGTLLGQFVGYICSRGRGRLSGRILEQLTFVPYLVPSIALGAIYLSMFTRPHLFIPALYGTFTLLILINVVKHLPYSSRAGMSNMLQIGCELEEAAEIEGASFPKRLWRIILPLSKPGFMSSFILIFISVIKGLDLVILLITPRMSTLPYMAFTYANKNFEPYANVVAVTMFCIILAVYMTANKVSKLDFSKGIGG